MGFNVKSLYGGAANTSGTATKGFNVQSLKNREFEVRPDENTYLGNISYGAKMALDNGTIDTYKPINDSEKSTLDAYKKWVEEQETEADTTTAPTEKDGFFPWLGKQAMAGLGQFNKSISATLDFILPTEFLGRYDFISNMNDYYTNANNYYSQEAAKSSASRGKGWDIGGDVIAGTVAALPNAILAYMSAGTSLGAQGASTGLQASSAAATAVTGSTAKQMLGNAVKTVAKNPMYWSSFLQTVGNDYEDAKANGANEFVASSTAILTSLLNAGVEVTGGIETLPTSVKQGGKKAIWEWVKSSVDEGKEEVIQGIITNSIAKMAYDSDRQVINPKESLKEFALGTAVGGILGGGQTALGTATRNVTLRNTGKNYNDIETTNALIEQGLQSPKGTESREIAEQLNEKLLAGKKITNAELGQLVYANEAQISKENRIAENSDETTHEYKPQTSETTLTPTPTNTPATTQGKTSIEVGDVFKGTTTGNTVRIIDRNEDTTTVAMQTADGETQKNYSNSAVDALISNSNYEFVGNDITVNTETQTDTYSPSVVSEPKSITLTQMGDFYEAFGDDAVELAEKLNLQLTSKTINGQKVQMVGFPVHVFDKYKSALGNNYNLTVSSTPTVTSINSENMHVTDAETAENADVTNTDVDNMTGELLSLKHTKNIYSLFKGSQRMVMGDDIITDGICAVPYSDEALGEIKKVYKGEITKSDNYSISKLPYKENDVVIQGNPKVHKDSQGNKTYVFFSNGKRYTAQQKYIDAFNKKGYVIKAKSNDVRVPWSVYNADGELVALFSGVISDSKVSFDDLLSVSEVLEERKTANIQNQATDDKGAVSETATETVNATVAESIVPAETVENIDTEIKENAESVSTQTESTSTTTENTEKMTDETEKALVPTTDTAKELNLSEGEILSLKHTKNPYSVFKDADTVAICPDCIMHRHGAIPYSEEALAEIKKVWDGNFGEINRTLEQITPTYKENDVIIQGNPKVIDKKGELPAYAFNIDGEMYVCQQKFIDAYSGSGNVIKANKKPHLPWSVFNEDGELVAVFLPLRAGKVADYDTYQTVNDILNEKKRQKEELAKRTFNQTEVRNIVKNNKVTQFEMGGKTFVSNGKFIIATDESGLKLLSDAYGEIDSSKNLSGTVENILKSDNVYAENVKFDGESLYHDYNSGTLKSSVVVVNGEALSFPKKYVDMLKKRSKSMSILNTGTAGAVCLVGYDNNGNAIGLTTVIDGKGDYTTKSGDVVPFANISKLRKIPDTKPEVPKYNPKPESDTQAKSPVKKNVQEPKTVDAIVKTFTTDRYANSFESWLEVTMELHSENKPWLNKLEGALHKIDKQKAKEYFENKFGKELSDTEVRQETEKFLTDFIQKSNEKADVKFSISKDVDTAYFDAIESGDMETAQKLVEDYARERGYSPESEHQTGHIAPSNNNDFDVPIYDLTAIYPSDVYEKGVRYYGTGESYEYEAMRKLNAVRGNPDKKIMIYRAVPASVKEDSIRNGDWVTISREYAKLHGESNIPGKYRIISAYVPAKYVFTDGNSLAEQGYDTGRKMAYANTKNNRKLLETITYDNDGNIIPLSKRFSKRNIDERFSIVERGTENEQSGNNSLLGNGRRTDNESAGEQNRQLQSSERKNQGKTEAERKAAAKKLFAEQKTGQEIISTKKGKIRINAVNPDGYDDDMQSVVDAYKEDGIETVLFVGRGEKAFDGNKKLKIDGFAIGNKVYLRYDGKTAPQNLKKHEIVHIKWDTPEMLLVRESILGNMSEDEKNAILNEQRYLDYAEVYGDDIDAIFEEFVADILAEMNTRTEQYADVVSEYWNSGDVDSFKVSEYTESIDAGGKNAYPISKSDIEAVQSIGKKSVNEFTSDDIKKTEAFAKRYYAELGEKSPFFRVWFGDWRANDTSSINVVEVNNIALEDVVMANGDYNNADTGWNIHAGAKLKDETRHYSRGERISVKILNDVKNILENAVLLDSEISVPTSNKKSKNTLFMHKMYTPIKYKGKNYVAKMSVEEYYDENVNVNVIKKRGYHLQAIKIEAADGSLVADEATTTPRSDTASTISVSDLFKFVKQSDTNFQPKPVSEALLNDDGTPKVMYHGTGDFGFTVFDSSKSDDGLSIFFTDDVSIASTYSGVTSSRNLSETSDADIENMSVQEVVEKLSQIQTSDDKYLNTVYEYYNLKTRDELIQKVNDTCKELNTYLQTVDISNEKNRVSTWSYIEKLKKLLDDGEYGSISTPLYMLLHHTDVFRESAELSQKFAELESNARLMNQLREQQGTEFVVARNLHGYDFNVFTAKSAKGFLGLQLAKGNYAVYLNMENPLVVECNGALWNDIGYKTENGKVLSTTRDIAKYAKSKEYDGVVFHNIIDNGGQNFEVENNQKANVYIVFNSRQIKSATDNIGTFDGNNPDIRYALSKDSYFDMIDFLDDVTETTTVTKQETVHSSKDVKLSNKKANVKSAAFKNWFGDWENEPVEASKVVNDDGTPKIMYHGTNAEFWTFDESKSRTNTLNFGKGFYFASKKSMAENYTESGRVIEAYLNLREPYVVYGIYLDEIEYNAISTQANEIVTRENVSEVLQKLGYDGIIAKNYNGTTNPINQVVVFDASQIKSATDNIGTYDKNKKDIRYSRDAGDIASLGNKWNGTEIVSEDKKKSEQQSIGDIVKSISNKFDIPISTGKVTVKDASGIYKEKSETIRTRITNNLPTISHELGHHFDKLYNLSQLDSVDGLREVIPAEFLDNYEESEKNGEAVAEFIRVYLRNTNDAHRLSPDFYADFVRTVSKEDLKALNEVASAVNEYLSYNISERYDAAIVSSKKSEKLSFKDKWHKLYSDWVDAFHAQKEAVDYVENVTGQSLSGKGNAYVLATNSLNAHTIANYLICDGFRDLDGNMVDAKSFVDSIGMVDSKNVKLLDKYLVLRHSLEWIAPQHEDVTAKRVFADDTLENVEEIKKQIAEIEKEHPEIKTAAENLYEYQNNVIKHFVIPAGGMSVELLADLNRKYPSYVPFYRAVGKQSGMAKGTFVNQKSPIKTAKGSGADIISPVESIIRNTEKMVKLALRNQTADTLGQYADTVDGFGQFMEKVTPDMIPHISDLSKHKEKFNDALQQIVSSSEDYFAISEALDAVFGDSLTDFTPIANASKRIITVLRDGKPSYYQIHDEDLYKAVAELSTFQLESAAKWSNMIMQPMKMLTTQNNPIFAGTNAIRDFGTAYKLSDINNPISFAIKYALSLKGILSNSKDYRQYKAMGGGHSSELTASIDNISKTLRRVAQKDMGKARRLASALFMHPVETVARFNDLIESTPRFMEFQRTLESDGDLQKAIYNANDLTTNFSRKGASRAAKEANAFIMYNNAAIQGLDKMARTFKDPKKRYKTLLKWGLNALIMAALQHFWNDEVDEEGWRNLSAYKKNNFYNFAVGDGQFISLPKPRENGILDSFTERTIEYVFGNDEAFYDFGGYVATNIIPPMLEAVPDLAKGKFLDAGHSFLGNTVLGGIADAGWNEDFKGTPIESDYDKYNPSNERYSESTTKLAYALGQTEFARNRDLSPKQIDHLISSYTGILGQVNKALFPMNEERRDVTIGLRNKFISDSNYSTDVLNRMDENQEKAEKAFQYNGTVDTAIEYEKNSIITSYISGMDKAVKALPKDEQRNGRAYLLKSLNSWNYENTASQTEMLSRLDGETVSDDCIVTSVPKSNMEWTVTATNEYGGTIKGADGKALKIKCTYQMTPQEYDEYIKDYLTLLEKYRSYQAKTISDTTAYTQALAEADTEVKKVLKKKYQQKYYNKAEKVKK